MYDNASWNEWSCMDLKTYLELKGVKIKEFADIIGVDASTVSKYINWHRKPSLDIAQRIVKATKGKVSIEDLLAYWEAKKDHG
jgi:DNA-binding transcriptional regulator YdaS (Cro superfamily)